MPTNPNNPVKVPFEISRAGGSVATERPVRQARHGTFSGASTVAAGSPAGNLPASPLASCGPESYAAGSAEKIVVIGASAGGTVAIRKILSDLPADIPGLIVVLHMPAGFTASYAQSLDAVCAMRVKEAADGDPICAGCAYIAPGGRHLLLEKKHGSFRLKLDSGPPVNRHRPSVDKTFFSAAACSSPHSMGIILTGMGDDGARGLKEMHTQGCVTVAQDQESCLVFGMPRRAIAMGAAAMVLPLDEIPQAILRFIRKAN